MAKSESAVTEDRVEMVSVFLPKIPGRENTVWVGLNGKGYLIPRGKTVEVPKPVAQILASSERSDEEADAYSEEQQRRATVIQGAPV